MKVLTYHNLINIYYCQQGKGSHESMKGCDIASYYLLLMRLQSDNFMY